MARPDITPGQGPQPREVTRRQLLGGIAGMALTPFADLSIPLSHTENNLDIPVASADTTVALQPGISHTVGKTVEDITLSEDLPFSAEDNLKAFWGDSYIAPTVVGEELRSMQSEPIVFDTLPEGIRLIEGYNNLAAGEVTMQVRAEMNRYLTDLFEKTRIPAETAIGGYWGTLWFKGTDNRWYQTVGGNKTLLKVDEEDGRLNPILAVRHLGQGAIQLNQTGTVRYELNGEQRKRLSEQVIVGEPGSAGPSYSDLREGNFLTLAAGENPEPSPQQENPSRMGRPYRNPTVDENGRINAFPSEVPPVIPVRYEERTRHYVDDRIQAFIDRYGSYGDALFGLPISPAITTKAITDRVEGQVRLQLFERATVTDNLNKPEEWQLERGNDAQVLLRILANRETLGDVNIAPPEARVRKDGEFEVITGSGHVISVHEKSAYKLQIPNPSNLDAIRQYLDPEARLELLLLNSEAALKAELAKRGIDPENPDNIRDYWIDGQPKGKMNNVPNNAEHSQPYILALNPDLLKRSPVDVSGIYDDIILGAARRAIGPKHFPEDGRISEATKRQQEIWKIFRGSRLIKNY